LARDATNGVLPIPTAIIVAAIIAFIVVFGWWLEIGAACKADCQRMIVEVSYSAGCQPDVRAAPSRPDA
jgi:hypothetical protein